MTMSERVAPWLVEGMTRERGEIRARADEHAEKLLAVGETGLEDAGCYPAVASCQWRRDLCKRSAASLRSRKKCDVYGGLR